MSDPFVGEIKLVGFNYAPRNYAECSGTIEAISNNPTLFSLLGTTYGGDGRTTFGLPDLRGRRPVSEGTGPGLYPVYWGQFGGHQVQSLSILHLPSHTHGLKAYSGAGSSTSPSGSVLAAPGAGAYTGEVPAGIPVTGTTTIRGNSGDLQNGQTSEARSISGTVSSEPYAAATPNADMSYDCISDTGSSQPFSIQSPYLGMLYVIALAGQYPPRN